MREFEIAVVSSPTFNECVHCVFFSSSERGATGSLLGRCLGLAHPNENCAPPCDGLDPGQHLQLMHKVSGEAVKPEALVKRYRTI